MSKTSGFSSQEDSINKRITIVGFFFSIFFIVICLRLFFWQVVKGEELKKQAQSQYSKNITLGASRGNILADDETWLAANSTLYNLYASLPDISSDKTNIATMISRIITTSDELEKGDYQKKLLTTENKLKSILFSDTGVWVLLAKGISETQKAEINNLNTKGLNFEDYETRIYPEGSIAAQLLGFVGKEESGADKGYFGLEGYYDSILKGKSGFESSQADVRGIPLLFDGIKKIDSLEGIDLVTSINKGIQLKVESKLESGIEKYGAKSGSIVIMNPNTGEIIAMASYPSFDPQKYSSYKSEDFLNPIISSSFEPGSVFKVIAMAGGLDAGVITPDTICDICAAPFKIGSYFIHTWDDKYRANTTMTEVIVHSDNVGMTFVGRRLGEDQLVRYLRDFGFGSKTGIDLQGEMTPRLRDKWGEIDLATATFGQGIAITPIQLITAVAAIANDGVSVRPHIVTKLKLEGGEEIVPIEPGKRIISKKAADQMTAMMSEAAKNGEAKWTNLSGYRVAGKTGTAQIPISGHYDAEKTIASFIGFAPYDDPKFIMLVTLREPQSSPWASETAAPLWYSIARDLFYQYGIQPEN